MKNTNSSYLKALELELDNAEQNKDAVLALLNKAASEGSSDAQYALGTFYLHGKYVDFDPQKTLDFLRDAADQMHPDALFDLGIALETGKIVDQNLKAAFRCYLHAMMFGSRTAIYEVARCLYHGIGTNRNRAMHDTIMIADDFLKRDERVQK